MTAPQPTTAECVEWLDANIRLFDDTGMTFVPKAIRAQLLAAHEMAKACEDVIRLSDRKVNEWDRAKAAIAAWKAVGGQ